MTRQKISLLAGTAIGLFVASGAYALNAPDALDVPVRDRGAVILAEGEGDAPVVDEEKKDETPAEAPAETVTPPADETTPPADEPPADNPPADPAPADDSATSGDSAPIDSAPAEIVEPPADEPSAVEEPVEEPTTSSDPAPVIDNPPADETPADNPPADEPPAATEPAPPEETPAETETAPSNDGATDTAPATETPTDGGNATEAPATNETAPADEAPATETAPAEGTAPADGTAPAEGTAPTDGASETAPADSTVAPDDSTASDTPPADTAPVIPAEEQVDPTVEPVLPEGPAPVLDSAKEEPLPGADGAAATDGSATTAPAEPTEPPPPPPTDDAAAQPETIRRAKVQPATEEQGTRLEAAPVLAEQPRPEGSRVVKQGKEGSIIIQFNNQIFVESNDRKRMSRGADEVYYEELRGGRTRETVVRDNGVSVVTIRDRYGDVIRRSRITPDGREYVLVYVDERDYDRGWRDPGRDLPPMRLTIPVEDYILDAASIDDEDEYYSFLDQPPVERVERLYSIDEVKRSARVRDKTRRIDLDTITFEFGKASIAENEVEKLQGIADGMIKLLERNPAETFLIEGHTDAVGSNLANLDLSDRRAEAVASALTDVFGIPPENLATQGYGERYLKVRTEKPEQANRRVSVRRVTALVAPVAAAN